jgi:hypothetical protein
VSDEPLATAPPPLRSRSELLRLLHDEPRAVSRAEIKAAFADGRLGEQDMDIPVLAGMRRITELLADLGPVATATSPALPPDLADTPAFGTPAGGRATATSVRVSELEAVVAALADRVAALESGATADRAARTAQEVAIVAQARMLRAVGITLAVVAAALAIAVVLSLVGR